MPIENSFQYIDDLNALYPEEQDQVSTTDEHVQGIKSVLKNQFPNLGDAVVTASAAGLNDAGLRYVGYGGMSINNGTNVFNLPGNNSDREMDAVGANIYGANKVTSDPSTGINLVTGLTTLNSTRIHVSLTLKRTDTSSITAGAVLRAWVKRVSDQSIVKSCFGISTIPSVNKAVQFTLEGVDPDPPIVGESYVVMWNHGDNSTLSFQQSLYNFWVEPVGEE